MNVIVVGAGNAGRPVARLLNYAGHTVKITDPKKIEDFHMDVQKTLRLMESEGVELDLGVFEPNLDGIDTVYLSPTVPENAPAYKIIKEANLNVTNQTISLPFHTPSSGVTISSGLYFTAVTTCACTSPIVVS